MVFSGHLPFKLAVKLFLDFVANNILPSLSWKRRIPLRMVFTVGCSLLELKICRYGFPMELNINNFGDSFKDEQQVLIFRKRNTSYDVIILPCVFLKVIKLRSKLWYDFIKSYVFRPLAVPPWHWFDSFSSCFLRCSMSIIMMVFTSSWSVSSLVCVHISTSCQKAEITFKTAARKQFQQFRCYMSIFTYPSSHIS